MAKSISHCQGKGSLTHNTRKFSAKNVDTSRTPDNVIFVNQPIEQAYTEIFGAAVERYNAKQKRADRKITTSYFEHVFKRDTPPQYVVTSSDKRKSFYEDIVYIGDMHDTGCGTADAKISVECLTEYMNGFQERNPNFRVFLSVLHLDEATPHLHIDYIPIGHYKQGLDTQNGLAQALKEMGYGTGKDAINRWRLAERAVLEKICAAHGIEISAPQKSRGSMTTEKYKEYAEISDKVDEKQKEVEHLDGEISTKEMILEWRQQAVTSAEQVIDKLDAEYQEKNAAVEQLDTELEKKNAALTETAAALADNEARLEQAQKGAAHIDGISELVQTAEMITRFGKPTGVIKIPEEPFVKLKMAAKGYDEDRKEVKRLQDLLEKATAEIKNLRDEIKKGISRISEMSRELVQLRNQNKLFKKAHNIPEKAEYNEVLHTLNEQGYLQKNKTANRKL